MPDPARSPAHLQTSDRARSLRSSRAPSSRLHDDDDNYAASRRTRLRDAATWNASVAALLSSSSNAQQPKSPASQPASPSPSLDTASPDVSALAPSPDTAPSPAASPDAASPPTADLDTAAAPDRDPQTDDPPPLDYQPIDSSIASRFQQCTGENVSDVLIAENPDLLQQGKRGVAIEGHCIEVIPGSLHDLQLCAHELTHIVQQRGPSTPTPTSDSDPEAEARAVEVSVPLGQKYSISIFSSSTRLFNNDQEKTTESKYPTRINVIGKIILLEYNSVTFKIQCVELIDTEVEGYTAEFPYIDLIKEHKFQILAHSPDRFKIRIQKDDYQKFEKIIGQYNEIGIVSPTNITGKLTPCKFPSSNSPTSPSSLAHSNTPNASPSPSNDSLTSTTLSQTADVSDTMIASTSLSHITNDIQNKIKTKPEIFTEKSGESALFIIHHLLKSYDPNLPKFKEIRDWLREGSPNSSGFKIHDWTDHVERVRNSCEHGSGTDLENIHKALQGSLDPTIEMLSKTSWQAKDPNTNQIVGFAIAKPLATPFFSCNIDPRPAKSPLRGKKIFDSLFQAAGGDSKINTIVGQWESNSDNTKTFNKYLESKSKRLKTTDKEDPQVKAAAFATFTGKMALEKKYTKVVVQNWTWDENYKWGKSEDPLGGFVDILSYFTK